MPPQTVDPSVLVAGLEQAINSGVPITLSSDNASTIVAALKGLAVGTQAGTLAEELLSEHETDAAKIKDITHKALALVDGKIGSTFAAPGIDIDASRAARSKLAEDLKAATNFSQVLTALISTGLKIGGLAV